MPVIACLNCTKKRTITQRQIGRSCYTGLCADCSRRSRSRENNPNWKGGRNRTTQGYILIIIYPDDFFYPMADINGYVLQHRLVMAKHLGRNLHTWEHIHHKDGDRQNNELSNLHLTTPAQHITDHHNGYKDGYAKGLADGRNKLIEKEINQVKLNFLIELQAIYKDGGMFHNKMGEFIQSLMEEVK